MLTNRIHFLFNSIPPTIIHSGYEWEDTLGSNPNLSLGKSYARKEHLTEK